MRFQKVMILFTVVIIMFTIEIWFYWRAYF